MELRQIMTTDVETITPTTTLEEAAERMRNLDTGFLPVCENGRLVGTVTDRDVTVRSTAEGKRPDTPVRDAMTHGVSYCFEDQDVEEAATLMAEEQIRRLPVVNREKKLVGVVSIGDVARETGDVRVSGSTLEEVSEDR